MDEGSEGLDGQCGRDGLNGQNGLDEAADGPSERRDEAVDGLDELWDDVVDGPDGDLRWYSLIRESLRAKRKRVGLGMRRLIFRAGIFSQGKDGRRME